FFSVRLFFFYSSLPPPHLHSFPTRRSSDLPTGDFLFQVNGIEIEGMNDEGVDFQYPWETSARRYHSQRLHISSFYIDENMVTNRDRKSTRLNSSHLVISYAVFCLKKKKKTK